MGDPLNIPALERVLERALHDVSPGAARVELRQARDAVRYCFRTLREAHSVLEAERDELWSAMQRVALNLCDCDARDGHECPVYPAEHREHCEYALAHRKRGEDDNALIEWDDPNLSLA